MKVNMQANVRMPKIERRIIVLVYCAVLAFPLLFAAGCSTQASSGAGNTAASTSMGSATVSTASLDTSGMDFEYTDRDLDGTWDDANATHVTLADGNISIEGEGASCEDSTLTITAAGTYVLSGSLEDGQVVVEAGADDKVQLVFDGVDITCDDGPALLVKQVDKAFLTLASGTKNKVADGSTYVLEEGSDEPYATIFSKDDFTINGNGTLVVEANYRHAICSKDDLVITGGNFTIKSVEDALRGRDCVKICGGDFVISSGGDGIKSNNDEDATRGFVSIDGGTFTLDAGDDGIQAHTLLRVMDGTFDIHAIDDALHSETEGLIGGGNLTIDAGDDAVHAETVLTVAEGIVDVTSCYEGYEAEKIYINGATTHIIADDDAINAASAEEYVAGEEGTNEAQTDGGRPTGMMEKGGFGASDENCLIEINGGYTVISAGGDGIDSNGSYVQNDGVMLVCGPTNNGNGAFDYDISATINGGYFLAVGSSGMAQNFSSGSAQPFAYMTFTGSVSGGQLVSLTDSSGAVLISFVPNTQYQMVLVSTPSMVEGSAYTLSIGGEASTMNEDGYATDGSLSGATSVGELTSSTTPSGGMGGLAGGAGGMGAPNQGDGSMRGGGQAAPPSMPSGTAPQRGNRAAGYAA